MKGILMRILLDRIWLEVQIILIYILLPTRYVDEDFIGLDMVGSADNFDKHTVADPDVVRLFSREHLSLTFVVPFFETFLDDRMTLEVDRNSGIELQGLPYEGLGMQEREMG